MPADGEDRDEQELHHQHEKHRGKKRGSSMGWPGAAPPTCGTCSLQQGQDIVESEDTDGEDAQDQHQPDAEELAAAVDHQTRRGDDGLADQDPAAHCAAAFGWISWRIRRAAAALSAAPVIGRPMTRKSAPSAEASPGVMIRFWSPTSEPAGRMPASA
jgi:hypothetical protein